MKTAHLLATLTLVSLASTITPLHASDEDHPWAQHCVRCHGEDGRGQTKMGRKLRIKDITSAKVQSRLTDERILEALHEGIKDNDGNERMPAFAQKLSDADRTALVAYVRSLGTKSASISSSE